MIPRLADRQSLRLAWTSIPILVLGALSPSQADALDAPTAVAVDADFPGGNVVVEKIEGDTVFLRQDVRDTKGSWFYWCFRVRNAAGRMLTFQFPGDLIGVRGPAVSIDAGKTWAWLGARRRQQEFVRLQLSCDRRRGPVLGLHPRTPESNLKEVLKRYEGNPT